METNQTDSPLEPCLAPISTITRRRRPIRRSSRSSRAPSRKISAIPRAFITSGSGQGAARRSADRRRATSSAPSRPKIVFTSGGTEADNLALRGAAEALEPPARRHLVTSSIEHEAVLNTVKALARRGWSATLLPVDATGIVVAGRARRCDHRSRRRSCRSCTRTTRSARFSRSPSSPRSRTSTARCSTPTRCSRSRRFRSTCGRSASICCRSRRTSSTDPRGPARSGSSAARGWSRR